MIEYNNCCVACGEIIPEGRQVCSQCEKKYDKEDEKREEPPITNCKKDGFVYKFKQFFYILSINLNNILLRSDF